MRGEATLILLGNFDCELPASDDNRKVLNERRIGACIMPRRGHDVGSVITELCIDETSDIRGLAQDLIPRLVSLPGRDTRTRALFAELLTLGEKGSAP